MIRFTLSILEEHRVALQKSVLRDASEYAAILVCGRSRSIDPWTGAIEERFLVRDLIEVPENAFAERTPTGLTWSTTPFYQSLKLVEDKAFGLAVVHSHPSGPLRFSPKDDVAEREMFQIAFDRLDNERPHLSVIMDGNGDLVARAYGPDLKPHDTSLIRFIGSRWRFKSAADHEAASPEFDRQLRVFGRQTMTAIEQLRVGVVGCGGMGSAAAMLLARIGVRRLALFDFDYVDETNLNRLHFSTRSDANLRRKKVDVVGEGVAQIGLPISVVRIPHNIDDERARNALLSCDVIFGCTDDHLGRNMLNRLAHFYLIPVIDLGLLIQPNGQAGYDVFDGRVTVVQPGYPCQVCRGLIDPSIMLAESLRRNDPVLYEQRRRAGYIVGSPDPSPVVVTFTTEVATMAVNELFQRLSGFRGADGAASERVRKFEEVKDADTLPAGKSRLGCRLCDRRRYDGRGDMTPFLDTTP